MELSDLPVVIPTGSLVVVLIALIVHLSRQSSGDRDTYQARLVELRKEHREEIKQINEHHEGQVKRLISQHDGDISDLRSEVQGLRNEMADVRRQLEDERRARWRAEDAAARYRRMIDAHTDVGEQSDEPRH